MRDGVVLALAALCACGTTQIRTSDPTARIYLDGKLLGRGHAETTRRGPPHTATVTVATDDGRHASLQVARRFTATTLLTTLVSWVGLATMWELPEDIFLPLSGGGWDRDDDVWAAPPTWAVARAPDEP
jgi:hypothetical protein